MVAHLALYCLTAVLAWSVARSDPRHRWIAAYVTWMATTDAVRAVLPLMLAGAPRPFAGVHRALFHLDELFVLSWSFLFVAACLHYFARRSPLAAIACWVATFLLCVTAYPRFTGQTLALLYRVTALATLGASWLIIVWAIVRRRDLEPGLAHLVLILYAATDVVLNLLPLAGELLSNWPVARAANLLLLAVFIFLHVGWHVRRRRAARVAA